jgi:hypothetical protein
MPAGSTYTPIATTTLGAAASDVTFSTISGAYTDLVLVVNSIANSSNISSVIQVGNGSIDTGSNYSATILYGDGSSPASTRTTSGTAINLNFFAEATTTAPNIIIVHLQNYSNTTTYKTLLSRAGGAPSGVSAIVGLWRSTAAINTIKISRSAAINYATGSSFTLYGIASA